VNFGPASSSHSPFKKCLNQTYALYAVASRFVFNKIAYCRCDVKTGDSISLPFDFDAGRDVCTVNAKGAANGYMVSTYSVPDSVRAPDGTQAVYTCPAKTSDGAMPSAMAGSASPAPRGSHFRVLNSP